MKPLLLLLLAMGAFFTASAQYLPKVNKATLAVVREQQKLARDVYDTLHRKWDLPVFGEIAGSEEAHMAAVKGLLDQHSVEDPVIETADMRGLFVHKPFQRLYDSLVLSGTASPEGALRAGAFLEEMDILSLQKAVQGTTSEDQKAIYKYLLVGAQRHLLSFARHLKKMGVTYEQVLLSKREYQRIIGASGGGTGR